MRTKFVMSLFLALFMVSSAFAENLGKVNFDTSPIITTAVTVATGASAGVSAGSVNLGSGAVLLGIYSTGNQDQLVDNVTLTTLTASVDTITLTDTDPVAITTTAAHGLSTGDRVWITGVVGTVELNSNWWQVTVVDTDDITLVGTDSSDFTAYTSGGTLTSEKGKITVTLGAAATADNTFNVTTFKNKWK